jgi:hypothetical protein
VILGGPNRIRVDIRVDVRDLLSSCATPCPQTATPCLSRRLASISNWHDILSFGFRWLVRAHRGNGGPLGLVADMGVVPNHLWTDMASDRHDDVIWYAGFCQFGDACIRLCR